MDPERAEGGQGGEQRLSSWKAIARHLGRDVRTVARWEVERGMPVHRVPGSGGRGPVFAYPSELDEWLRSESSASKATVHAVRRPRWLLPGAGIVILAGAIGLTSWVSRLDGPRGSAAVEPPPRMVESFTASGPILKGWGSRGQAVVTLTHPEGREFSSLAVARSLEGTARSSQWIVAANVLLEPQGRLMEGEAYRVDPSGAIAWRRRVTSSVTFGAETFTAPWVSESVATEASGASGRVLWAVRHQTWWPSLLLLLGSDGETLGQFVNAGWIQEAAFADVGGAPRILAGGISNSRRAAAVAVFRPDSLAGSSPEDEGSPYACSSCAPGGPERYILFPPTEVSRASGVRYNRVLAIVPTAEGLQVWTQEGAPGSDIAWVYLIAPDFRSVRAAPSDSYWARHEVLHAGGSLDHPSAQCPERAIPPVVRMWQPDLGWSVVPGVVSPPGG